MKWCPGRRDDGGKGPRTPSAAPGVYRDGGWQKGMTGNIRRAVGHPNTEVAKLIDVK